MQSASFLAFQRGLEKGQGRSNSQALFGIGRIPWDNYIRDRLDEAYIRDRLDEADPALLQPCFERMETLLTGPPLRQAFGRLGGRTLIAWDGAQYFCSQKLGCPNCLTLLGRDELGHQRNDLGVACATTVADSRQ